MVQNLIYAVNNVFKLYFFLIILRIFLTYIRSIRWENQPWKTIREVTDLYLNLFRRIIPPFGGLDFSPIIAIIVLQIIQVLVITAISSLAKGL